MYYDTHAQARTTAAIREQIQQARGSATELAKRFGVSAQTIRKWRRRDSVHDRSHRPHRLQTCLNGSQENLVVLIRRALRLPLDDLLGVVRQFILPEISRSALDRTLRRRGVSRLAALRPIVGTADDSDSMLISVLAPTAAGLSNSTAKLLLGTHPVTRWTYAVAFNPLDPVSVEQCFAQLAAAAPFELTELIYPNGERGVRQTPAPGAGTAWRLAARAAHINLPKWAGADPLLDSGPGRAPQPGETISENVKTREFSAAQGWAEALRELFERINRQAQLPCLNQLTPHAAIEHYCTGNPGQKSRSGNAL